MTPDSPNKGTEQPASSENTSSQPPQGASRGKMQELHKQIEELKDNTAHVPLLLLAQLVPPKPIAARRIIVEHELQERGTRELVRKFATTLLALCEAAQRSGLLREGETIDKDWIDQERKTRHYYPTLEHGALHLLKEHCELLARKLLVWEAYNRTHGLTSEARERARAQLMKQLLGCHLESRSSSGEFDPLTADSNRQFCQEQLRAGKDISHVRPYRVRFRLEAASERALRRMRSKGQSSLAAEVVEAAWENRYGKRISSETGRASTQRMKELMERYEFRVPTVSTRRARPEIVAVEAAPDATASGTAEAFSSRNPGGVCWREPPEKSKMRLRPVGMSTVREAEIPSPVSFIAAIEKSAPEIQEVFDLIVPLEKHLTVLKNFGQVADLGRSAFIPSSPNAEPVASRQESAAKQINTNPSGTEQKEAALVGATPQPEQVAVPAGVPTGETLRTAAEVQKRSPGRPVPPTRRKEAPRPLPIVASAEERLKPRAPATLAPTSPSATKEDATLEKNDKERKFLERFFEERKKSGYKEALSKTPTGRSAVFYVSSWCELPRVLRHVQEGNQNVIVRFAPPANRAAIQEIRSFLRALHGKSPAQAYNDLRAKLTTANSRAVLINLGFKGNAEGWLRLNGFSPSNDGQFSSADMSKLPPAFSAEEAQQKLRLGNLLEAAARSGRKLILAAHQRGHLESLAKLFAALIRENGALGMYARLVSIWTPSEPAKPGLNPWSDLNNGSIEAVPLLQLLRASPSVFSQAEVAKFLEGSSASGASATLRARSRLQATLGVDDGDLRLGIVGRKSRSQPSPVPASRSSAPVIDSSALHEKPVDQGDAGPPANAKKVGGVTEQAGAGPQAGTSARKKKDPLDAEEKGSL